MTITLAGNVDIFSAGGLEQRAAYAGMIKDSTEFIELTRINNTRRFVATGTADATAAGLYGGSSSLDTLTLILNVDGQGASTLTLAKATNVATQAAFLAAIKAKTEWAGVDAKIGGPNGNQLLITAKTSLVVGAGTANTALGLTAATVTAQAVVAIDFGTAVAYSTYGTSNYENQCQAPTQDTDQIMGIAIRDTLVRPVGSDHIVNYAAAYPVRILRLGFIWAYAAEAVTRGDVVCSITQGNSTIASNGALGSISTSAAGVGRVALDGTSGNIKATWEQTLTAGQLGVIWVR